MTVQKSICVSSSKKDSALLLSNFGSKNLRGGFSRIFVIFLSGMDGTRQKFLPALPLSVKYFYKFGIFSGKWSNIFTELPVSPHKQQSRGPAAG
jgi:hypothetical protein